MMDADSKLPAAQPTQQLEPLSSPVRRSHQDRDKPARGPLPGMRLPGVENKGEGLVGPAIDAGLRSSYSCESGFTHGWRLLVDSESTNEELGIGGKAVLRRQIEGMEEEAFRCISLSHYRGPGMASNHVVVMKIHYTYRFPYLRLVAYRVIIWIASWQAIALQLSYMDPLSCKDADIPWSRLGAEPLVNELRAHVFATATNMNRQQPPPRPRSQPPSSLRR
ncbi:hypothetical protein CDD80_3497 [Ophiocordyceps camponoti-rufipedis]|uniref:Uncharacterized protein n=1 Tax=Ophiocordyceps camponoti-rufipedis TaxID=2004952 RepID=A0A2C5ZJC3_9HYPO|nr:hypothetical protein CDD80_3497 [Ophiocordyceps camponoti-rufipedis]